RSIASRGVVAFILFGVPARKDPEGSEAWNPDGISQRALGALRDELGDDHVMLSDLCLDEYTDHGHCGVLAPDGSVDNDATLERYRRGAPGRGGAGARPGGRAALDERESARPPSARAAARE